MESKESDKFTETKENNSNPEKDITQKNITRLLTKRNWLHIPAV